MSYVLNALLKSEQERIVGTIPSADDIMRAPAMPARRRDWMVIAIGVGLILTVLFLLVGLYTGLDPRSPAVTSLATMVPPQPTQMVPPTPLSSPSAHNGALVESGSVATPTASGVYGTGPVPDGTLSLSRTLSSPPSAVYIPVAPPSPQYKEQFTGIVAGIVDGCTLEIKNKRNYLQKVRLASIHCLPSQTLAGKEARLFTTHTVFTQEVVVAVWQDDGGILIADLFDRENTLLNRALVLQGFANAVDGRFQADEQEARTVRRGLWQNPHTWRGIP